MAYLNMPISVSGGLVADLPAVDLENNQFSTIHNLRLKSGRLTPVQGHSRVFDPPPVNPEHVRGLIQNDTPEIYVAGSGKLYKNSNGLWEDVTRTSGGNYAVDAGWSSTALNSCLYFNNESDRLQVKEVADADFKDSVNLPANFKAKTFRGFKNYLFALNIEESGQSLPLSLRWSDPADVGVEPPSWDVTDPTTQAGQLALADTDGELVDASQLRDQLIIYKTDSVYSCQFIGGIYVFSFAKIFEDRGMLSRECVSQFEGKHFVVDFDDIYIHDGIQDSSIADKKVKDLFFRSLNQDFYQNVFTVSNPEEKEIWICYPDDNSVNGSCNTALVWNWVYNTWSTRDLPNLAHATTAIVDPKEDEVWNTGRNVSWDLGSLHWDANAYSPANSSIVMASKEDTAVYQVDNSSLFDGQTYEWVLEKLSASLGDLTKVKYLNSMTPNIAGEGTISVRVGSQYNSGDGVSWKTPTTYSVGKFRHYLRGQGRYISFRLSGNSGTALPLIESFTIQYTTEGGK